VFNLLFVEYSLAKNNLNNIYNMMSKKISKTMNYLIILGTPKFAEQLNRAMSTHVRKS
jgi:hypothetical protein